MIRRTTQPRKPPAPGIPACLDFPSIRQHQLRIMAEEAPGVPEPPNAPYNWSSDKVANATACTVKAYYKIAKCGAFGP